MREPPLKALGKMFFCNKFEIAWFHLFRKIASLPRGYIGIYLKVFQCLRYFVNYDQFIANLHQLCSVSSPLFRSSQQYLSLFSREVSSTLSLV